MKGYKVFNWDWTCNGFQYELGKKAIFNGTPQLCSRGFHFCESLLDCWRYYGPMQWNKIAEIEASGVITEKHDDSKRACSELLVVKELSFEEAIEIIKKQSREEGSSNGVSYSNGVRDSYGVLNSSGICLALFVTKIKSKPMFFNKPISQKRFDKIMTEFKEKLNGWYPKFNNAFKLYDASGREWQKTPVDRIESVDNKTAWEDMPQEAIDYLKSIKGFDKKIFKEITGIEVKE